MKFFVFGNVCHFMQKGLGFGKISENFPQQITTQQYATNTNCYASTIIMNICGKKRAFFNI